MSADVFKFKRGTTAQVAAYLPALGEPVVDTTLNQLHLGDGVTMGGLSIGTLTSPFMATLLDDTSAAAALLTLGAASLASPTFTGVPAAPTAAPGTNTTQLANTAFVEAVRIILVAADALKAPLASPALTGTPTAPTAAPGTDTTQLATTAFVEAVRVALVAVDALKAPLASPALTGTPTAPTPAVGTNTTQLATTAMTQAEIANKRTWTAYTPTITATTGTFTTVTATGKHMVAFGICHLQVVITVTTRGTGTNPIFSLPFPALSGSATMPLMAREGAINGKVGAGRIEAGLTTATCFDYALADLVTANGCIIYINGSYPIA